MGSLCWGHRAVVGRRPQLEWPWQLRKTGLWKQERLKIAARAVFCLLEPGAFAAAEGCEACEPQVQVQSISAFMHVYTYVHVHTCAYICVHTCVYIFLHVILYIYPHKLLKPGPVKTPCATYRSPYSSHLIPYPSFCYPGASQNQGP